jgi:FKBP-type peptidyl-prolyl cis-trans isomerase FkpA
MKLTYPTPAAAKWRLAAILPLALLVGCRYNPVGASVPFSRVDLLVGSGAEATAGKVVSVHYTGWLYSESGPDHKGLSFDSSVGRAPFTFVVGIGQVITGFDTGVVGMRVGGTRRIVVPPNLAYGAQGTGVIPPNSAIIFEVELLDVQ